MIFQTLNPATGELIKTFDFQSDSQVSAALNVADETYQQDWKLRSVADRAQIVKRAAAILRKNAKE